MRGHEVEIEAIVECEVKVSSGRILVLLSCHNEAQSPIQRPLEDGVRDRDVGKEMIAWSYLPSGSRA